MTGHRAPHVHPPGGTQPYSRPDLPDTSAGASPEKLRLEQSRISPRAQRREKRKEANPTHISPGKGLLPSGAIPGQLLLETKPESRPGTPPASSPQAPDQVPRRAEKHSGVVPELAAKSTAEFLRLASERIHSQSRAVRTSETRGQSPTAGSIGRSAFSSESKPGRPHAEASGSREQATGSAPVPIRKSQETAVLPEQVVKDPEVPCHFPGRRLPQFPMSQGPGHTAGVSFLNTRGTSGIVSDTVVLEDSDQRQHTSRKLLNVVHCIGPPVARHPWTRDLEPCTVRLEGRLPDIDTKELRYVSSRRRKVFSVTSHSIVFFRVSRGTVPMCERYLRSDSNWSDVNFGDFVKRAHHDSRSFWTRGFTKVKFIYFITLAKVSHVLGFSGSWLTSE